MKPIAIPASMHEVFGERSTLGELLLILATSSATCAALFALTAPEWRGLALWKLLLLAVLIFDILAGFVANLTLGTTDFYRRSPRARLVFIALHIQPLVLAPLLGVELGIGLAVWAYTVAAALAVNGLLGAPIQRPAAGSLLLVGLVGLLLAAPGVPLLLLVALAVYQLKVIYSFAVDHYAPRTA